MKIPFEIDLECPECHQVDSYTVYEDEDHISGNITDSPGCWTNLGAEVLYCQMCGNDFVARVSYSVCYDVIMQKIAPQLKTLDEANIKQDIIEEKYPGFDFEDNEQFINKPGLKIDSIKFPRPRYGPNY